MSTVEGRLATFDDLVALGEDVRAEIVGGEVHVSPAPLPRHSKAQRALGSFIGGPYDDDDGRGGPGGWRIFTEVDIALGPHDIVRPDLSGWKRERLPRPGDVRPITVSPDWVCEIISPATAARDRVTKRRLYATHGVRHYCILDPAERTLEVLELRDGDWLELGAYDETATARIAPFLDVDLEVGRLFLPAE